MKMNFSTALNNAQSMHALTNGVCYSRHAYVMKAGILNARGNLICVDKEIASLVNTYCN